MSDTLKSPAGNRHTVRFAARFGAHFGMTAIGLAGAVFGAQAIRWIVQSGILS